MKAYVRREWTDTDRHDVIERCQNGDTMPAIAHAYGVSSSALTRAMRSWGLTVRQARAGAVGARPMRHIVLLMGVTPKTVRTWIERGWLKARRNGRKRREASRRAAHGGVLGDRRYVWIHDLDLQAFLSVRAAWPSWEPERITDPLWREEAEDVRRGAGGRWVRLTDLARRWHYSETAAEGWLESGRLATETTRWGNWHYVWEPDGAPLVLAPARPMPKLKYTYPLARPCRGCGGTFYVNNARELHKKKTCGELCRRAAIGKAQRARHAA